MGYQSPKKALVDVLGQLETVWNGKQNVSLDDRGDAPRGLKLNLSQIEQGLSNHLRQQYAWRFFGLSQLREIQGAVDEDCHLNRLFGSK